MGLGLEAGLLWISGVMMVGQAGALIPMLGLASPDADYTGFVSNFPAPPWAANAVLLGLCAINFVLICRILRRLRDIARESASRSDAAAGAVQIMA